MHESAELSGKHNYENSYSLELRRLSGFDSGLGDGVKLRLALFSVKSNP